MSIETSDEVTEAVDALMKVADHYHRGSTILWNVIEAITGPRRDNRAKHCITKWRKRLEKEREIVTLCADNVGVRLLTHQETASEIPALRQRKAYRQIRKAIKQTNTVDSSRLSDHERRLLCAQRKNMAEQRRDLFRSQRQAEKGIVVTEGNPRRKLPSP